MDANFLSDKNKFQLKSDKGLSNSFVIVLIFPLDLEPSNDTELCYWYASRDIFLPIFL